MMDKQKNVLLKKMFDLTGKIVIITGGNGYLGMAMMEALAEFGAELYLLSRDEEKNIEIANYLTKKYGIECYGMKCDISNDENIKKVVNTIYEKNERIDVLINNSYYGAGKELENMTSEEWEKGIDGSINATFRCTKYTLKKMLEKGSGKIINIASMYGVVAPDVSIYEGNEYYNPPNYGCGKAAIIQFTKYIGSVYGSKGITANSISPGPFPSKEVQKNIDFIKRLTEKVPIGRVGVPDDLKGVVLLLASSASDFINGANIRVDGGWTIR